MLMPPFKLFLPTAKTAELNSIKVALLGIGLSSWREVVGMQWTGGAVNPPVLIFDLIGSIEFKR